VSTSLPDASIHIQGFMVLQSEYHGKCDWNLKYHMSDDLEHNFKFVFNEFIEFKDNMIVQGLM
jgi:hypothetical protein